MNLPQNLLIAIKAALESGAAIMDIYNNNFEVEFKSDLSPLTKADIASHDIIVKYLKGTNIPILSEEGKAIPYEERKLWNDCWIVDPLDGTKEFIKKNGEFTVNIAMVSNHIPIIGVVYTPALKELFFAESSIGSFKIIIDSNFEINNLLALSTKLPCKLTPIEFTIVASRSHLSEETTAYINELQLIHTHIQMISKGSSLKLCMVAEGEANCYPRFAPTMEWDTAAGHAICKYAGKNVIDWVTKKELLYNNKELTNNWFVVN